MEAASQKNTDRHTTDEKIHHYWVQNLAIMDFIKLDPAWNASSRVERARNLALIEKQIIKFCESIDANILKMIICPKLIYFVVLITRLFQQKTWLQLVF
jgi:hypothetical protein